uniref:AAA+ ATPase domain-containing protein n=1 Tax=Oryza punctata TaxID=4537 RepID=A0A0E0KVI7_ORYPU
MSKKIEESKWSFHSPNVGSGCSCPLCPHARSTPDLSIRMKDIVKQLHFVCAKVTAILNLELHHSISSTNSRIASSRPITIPTIKLTEEIKNNVPNVEGENTNGRAEEPIEQRLKSKRRSLILDDIWKCESDDWKRFQVPLTKRQAKDMVKTIDNSIHLEGLDPGEFCDLFLAYVFGDEQPSDDHKDLLADWMADTAINAAQWVVGKALGPVSDGLVEAWAASSELGANLGALKMELLYAQGVLDNAKGREIRSPALKELLQKLRDLAYDADDVLDELDYYRIQDELDGTCEAADEHAKGRIHNLVLNAHHTAKAAAGKLLGFSACSCASANHGYPIGPSSEQVAERRALCCAWPYDDRSASDDEEASGHIHKLASGARNTIRAVGKRLHCSSFPLVRDYCYGDGDSSISIDTCPNKVQHKKHTKEIPKLKFDRVGLSKRMKNIIEQLQPVCAKVTTILNLELMGSSRINTSSDAKGRPISTPTSIEPKLYGRDTTKKSIIDSITQGKYCDKDLTVLPIVGPGGLGKTTLVQHVYNSQEVQSHFQIKVWVCVSQNFNIDKLIEEINNNIPKVENENNVGAEELIEQRLKSKRFLLILDDIWKCESDDWKRLLVPFTKGQTKGNIILVTTRFPVVGEMIKTTDSSIDLEGLDHGVFRELFLACVFGDDSRESHDDLIEIGDKIAEKLKGSPLAAKTVGRLLRNHFDMYHWNRVLESREWEMEANNHDIMPALQLSYDYLPFHLQQCFSYCALFPEDYKFDTKDLIHFWIGLGILNSSSRKKTFEDIALSNLDDLVTHGFFKKDESQGHPCYIIHDLLRDLAVKVASHECVSLNCSNMRSVEIRPSIRHLSIITDGSDDSDGIIEENFRAELVKLKTKLKVENLQTLMIFGTFDESFVGCLGDLFKEATALRVLHLPKMPFPVESILHNFSALVHLRYLKLGTTTEPETHLPITLSRFYHLRILDLLEWDGCFDLPGVISNLAKLHNFLIPNDKPHAAISNVGKMQCLQELKRFEVNRQGIGFELRQLGYLMDLRELGIYNLERVHMKEATSEAKLLNKNRLQNLALHWDRYQTSLDPDKEEQVLENLQPHKSLKELSIDGHGGHTCPKWLGAELSVKFLETLRLSNVDWKIFPPLGEVYLVNDLGEELFSCITGQSFRKLKRLELVGLQKFRKWVATEVCPMFFSRIEVLIVRDCYELIELPFSYCTYGPSEGDAKITWFPRLKEVEINNCPNLVLLAPVPYTQTLCYVYIVYLGESTKSLHYSKMSSSLRIQGYRDLHVLDDKVLAFHNLTHLQELSIHDCAPMSIRHLQTLTSLKILLFSGGSNIAFTPIESSSDIEWQLPVEFLSISDWHDSGKELTQLLSHFPKLSSLNLYGLKKISRLIVAVEQQQMYAVEQEDTQATDEQKQVAEEMVEEEALTQLNVGQEEELDGLLLFPASLANSLQFMQISDSPELILVAHPVLSSGHKVETGAGGLQALRSLLNLHIEGCPSFLSAYMTSSFSSRAYCPFPSSLQGLFLKGVMGIRSKRTLENLSSLTLLYITDCGEDLKWDVMWPLITHGHLSSIEVFQTPKFFASRDPNLQDEQEEQQQLLQHSSKLQDLWTDDLPGLLVKPICSLLSSSLTYLELRHNHEVKRFTKEQDKALQLLTSLRDLHFWRFTRLQCLPAGLHRLTNLKTLEIDDCPRIQSLPKDGLPNSLQELDLHHCGNKKLKQRCEALWPLLTQGQLSKLSVLGIPRFFNGLDPKLGGLQYEQEQQLPPLQCSSKPLELETDDFAGVLVKPICRLLSSSLTKLLLRWNDEVERFTEEQEEALQLLTSLQDLQFWEWNKLQCLPVGLHRLTSLKRLRIGQCPSIRSLLKDGLPSSLQELDVSSCSNEKLKQRCRKPKGTIPEIILDW